MFASRGILEHLARGVVGLAALFVAAMFGTSHPWWSLLAMPVALVALRGCPMCWTIGLFQTVVARVRGRPTDASTDEACAAPNRCPPPR
jgi:hypothetical protein